MFFFDGCSCPVCGSDFSADDDIVVCPVCGTPHHRSCYKENGGCAFEAAHSEGYLWKRSDADTKAAPSSTTDGIRCAVCGAENPAGQLFCSSCGRQLFDRRSSSGASEPESSFFSVGSSEAAISDGELVDGVPVGDLKRFIGSSSYAYVPLFVMFERSGKKVSFNLIAFLAHGLWFIARKMYAVGAGLLLLQLAALAGQGYCAVQLAPALELYSGGDVSQAYEAVFSIMSERPGLIALMMISMIVHYAVMIFSGLFGCYMYKQFCTSSVKKINGASKTADSFNSQLENRGGLSLALALGCGVLYIALRMFLQSKFGI